MFLPKHCRWLWLFLSWAADQRWGQKSPHGGKICRKILPWGPKYANLGWSVHTNYQYKPHDNKKPWRDSFLSSVTYITRVIFQFCVQTSMLDRLDEIEAAAKERFLELLSRNVIWSVEKRFVLGLNRLAWHEYNLKRLLLLTHQLIVDSRAV